MAILINDTAPRSQYTATSGQTVFTVPFEFFENADLKVYKNSTLLTLTTNYTVTGAGVTGGGSVTLVTGATAGDIVTIVRDVAVKRVTDFPTSGPFNVEALNTDLDRLTAMVQQQETLDTRSLRLDQFDTPNSFDTLPVKASRVGRVLAFNASTGQPEAGPLIASTQTVADASADIDTVAGSIANVNTVAGNISNVNTVAGVSSGVSTVATNIASVNTVAADLNEGVSEINTVAISIANVDTVGTNISNVNTVASISANVTTVAGISSNVTTVAGNSANVTTVAGSISSVNTNATNIVAIQNASANASTATTKAAEASSSASAAAAAQTAAESARDSTLASFDSFDDRYLGSKTGDPALDNDGNALLAGALYFNSSAGIMKVYTGSAWVAAYVSGSDFLPLSGGSLTGSVVQTINSSADAFRITQTGAGNALLVEDSANPDSTPFVVNASGQVLIGSTSAPFGSTNLGIFQNNTDGNPPYQDFFKNRAGAIVTSGDGIGRQRFWGYDGAAYIEAARIEATIDGTPGTNDMPGRLLFYTTADGASSPTERMRINNSGNVGIGTISPSQKLTISGNAQIEGSSVPGIYINTTSGTNKKSEILIKSSGTTQWSIANDIDATNARSLAFYDGVSAATRMLIDSSGNVGIGTASPSTYGKLAVTTPTAGYGVLSVRDSAGGGGGGQLAYYYGTAKIAYVDSNVTNGTGGSETAELSFATANAGTIAERMRISSSGNVGIGTNSPSVRLQVDAGSSSELQRYNTTSTAPYVAWNVSGVRKAYQQWDASYGWAFDSEAASTGFVFRTQGSERARIDSSGNFSFNSGYGSAAVAYGCRAWLNYNLSTQTTRASANVSSVTYNSTGYFTINFTNAMPDANYSLAGMGEWTSGTTAQTYPFMRETTPPTTTTCPIVVSSSGFSNPTRLTIAVFR